MTKLTVSEEKTRGRAKALLCFGQSLLGAQRQSDPDIEIPESGGT